MSGQLIGPIGVLPAAAGGATPTWTPTDAMFDNAAGFQTTYTGFTNRAIGTASATRQVLVAIAVKNELGGAETLGLVIGGVTATMVSSGESSTSGVDVALFQANVTTGTTASLSITAAGGTNNNIDRIAVAIGVLDGVTATPTSVATAGLHPGDIASPYATGSGITVPTSGIGIGAAGAFLSPPGTPGWTNITKDATATAAGATVGVTMGHINTSGAITPSAVFGDFAQEVTLAAAWGP